MFEFIDVKFKGILDIPALTIGGFGITTIKGPSGSGKSTLLKLLNKLYSPTEGRILFERVDLTELNTIQHRRKVIMLSQNAVMFQGTIRDNMLAGLKFQKRELPGDERLLELMDRLKLNNGLDQPAESLSGGEKQRVALARVMLLEPDIYLLDEPSSALDEDTAQLIIHMLSEHVREGRRSLIMVTHSKAIAQRYSNVIVEVVGGKCVNREEVL